MQTYKNLNGQSGVVAYQVGHDYIIVQFREGRHLFYRYTQSSAGAPAIDRMKQLAQEGVGLNSFISSKSTRPQYALRSVDLAGVV